MSEVKKSADSVDEELSKLDTEKKDEQKRNKSVVRSGRSI